MILKNNYNTSRDYQLRAKMPGIGMIGSLVARPTEKSGASREHGS